MNIPCRKCPVLAICKTKERVECEILFHAGGKSHETIFNEAKKVLPNLREIQIGKMIVSSTNPHYRFASPVIWRKI
jgi:hypothetical protein